MLRRLWIWQRRRIPSGPKTLRMVRDAASDGFHRLTVEQISIRGKGEAWKRELIARNAPSPQTSDRNPPAAERDVARRAPRPARSTCGIVLALGTAEKLPILFHQDREDLLTDIDAEIEEGVLRVGECAEHRKRDLDGHALRKID